MNSGQNLRDILNGLSDDDLRSFFKGIVTKTENRYKQEILAQAEKALADVLVDFRDDATRDTWKEAQRWCKWGKDGPVLFPEDTRLYYRKGDVEIVIREFDPRVRILKFANRTPQATNSNRPFAVSLGLPYVIFVFLFRKGVFEQVQCSFSDRPLKTLEETPMIPFLTNVDEQLRVCLGHNFNTGCLKVGDIYQQVGYVLEHFWSSIFTWEFRGHFDRYVSHFQTDDRIRSLEDWQRYSMEDPLFVIDDVDWIPHVTPSYAELIVDLLDGNDDRDNLYRKELLDRLLEPIMDGLASSLSNLDNSSKPLNDASIDCLIVDVANKIKSLSGEMDEPL